MKKVFSIIITGAALAAGALTAFYLITKNRKPQIQDDLEPGLYLLNPFKKIICDMNKTIAETEKRLSDHDKMQKMYEEMEWNTSNN